MPKDGYQLEGENRIKALERLAERLGKDDFPTAVTDNLDPDLLWMAFSTDEGEYWGEAEREAQKLLNVYYGSPGTSRPPVAVRTVERLTRSW
jgi:hypothetical protein